MNRQPLKLLVLSAAVLCGPEFTRSEESEIAFRTHTLDATSEYSACAAIDVNRDGKLDIFCGGWWYESPSWKRHFVRQVRKIRGRYDGYSHLPLDVDNDGWTDVVNVNWRSESIYWVKNPGAADTEWPRIIIAQPGGMETGRLIDVDDDGVLDILPNGVHFAAWWKRIPKGNHSQWVRYDLPEEVAAHGIGFGDLNNDNRGDVIGPHGWLEAPVDRRQGKWLWHQEYHLHPDTSIPILVQDVDNDGDHDLIWARGHHYGIYWLEQRIAQTGRRIWVTHTIDTSWSQGHSLLWADLDGDTHPEVITGKRYMAHEGRDPGARDPLVIYRYQYDAERHDWKRHTITSGGSVGFGLDPKVIDLDDDGDLDLVVSGRSGLYWIENLLHP